MSVDHPEIKQGQRYRSLKDIPVLCLVSWEWASVTSHQAVLPAGETFYILNDTGGNMSIAHCMPENHKKMQSHFVPWIFRALFWMYRGYYVSIQQQRILRDCEYLGTTREHRADEARSAATTA